MRTTMKMRDLKKSDGFPTDIDRGKMVVVQVSEHSVIVLYTRKTTGKQNSWWLPPELNEIYAEDLYIIRPR